jgi:hypothetical protein
MDRQLEWDVSHCVIMRVTDLKQMQVLGTRTLIQVLGTRLYIHSLSDNDNEVRSRCEWISVRYFRSTTYVLYMFVMKKMAKSWFLIIFILKRLGVVRSPPPVGCHYLPDCRIAWYYLNHDRPDRPGLFQKFLPPPLPPSSLSIIWSLFLPVFLSLQHCLEECRNVYVFEYRFRNVYVFKYRFR